MDASPARKSSSVQWNGFQSGDPKLIRKKKTRRGRGKASKNSCRNISSNSSISDENTWSILHSNIRGLDSKKSSLKSILNIIKPNVLTLNEVGYKSNKKVVINGYSCYFRNRAKEAMGGVATCVNKKDSAQY